MQTVKFKWIINNSTENEWAMKQNQIGFIPKLYVYFIHRKLYIFDKFNGNLNFILKVFSSTGNILYLFFLSISEM